MALKNEKKDPYRLVSPSAPATLSSTSCSPDVLEVNNLSFIILTTLLPIIINIFWPPVDFNLLGSQLNNTSTITVTLIPMSSSFHFLGIWFNINGSQNFIQKQLKQECNSFSATLHPVKLTVQQVVYLHNTVLIPKLDYRMQVTHLSKAECSIATSSIRTLVKHKAKLSHSIPNVILYLSQVLAVINK
ncbi:hypothetical protein GLOIN_2v1817843 [Rhizophagus irregularis DAOM 181602=DAOM 197198]|nr:hypothetical protein GLOIN_2v1817843 [Rhizophagus irregularis DAOM 181602=DAOM 197198]